MSEETKNVVEETPVEEVKTPVEAAPETVETQAEVPAEAAAPAEAPKAEEPVVEKEEPVAEKAEEPVVEKEEPVAEKAEEPAAEKAEEIAAEKEEPVAEKKATRRSLLNASVASEDFDWEAFEGSVEVYGVEDRKKIEEAYDQTLSKVVENEVVEGTVTGISKREVIIDIGYKSEGVIQTPEFRYNPDLKVGDKVEVFVESVEDRKGQLLLSHKKARALKSWDRINEAANNDEIVKGFIKTRTKGGMIVDVFGIEAFLPGSQIDIKPIRDYDAYVNQTLDFKIVKINQEFRNVVVSHKALLEAEQEKRREELISKLEKGQILEGTVKNITNYGVFVDLGGVDGLVHITDLSWGRIDSPEEVVSLDQKIKVVVKEFDAQQKRIALGYKQLTPHPWDNLDSELKVGDIVKGKVVLIADYGAFVEIQPGVEGLIHVSEMSWSPRLHSAQEFVNAGDEVDAQILSIDRENRKMSLGLKQLTPNPWESIRDKYPVGSQHKAIVRNITNFGVFAELEDGVEGLIHISDLSWSKIKHPSEMVVTGDTIDVQILDFDEVNHKLSLGHKQLMPNPWDEMEEKYPVGSTIEATVKSLTDKGANITLQGEDEGFAFNRDLIKEDGKPAVVGETLPFKVVELRRSTRRILLSHLRTYSEAKMERAALEADTTKRAVKKINSNLEKTTLGDISELAALKDKLEKKSEKGK
ncbi:MAG: 30S ribosomal protein S1 [Bacteroidales bacterium]|jgi:small subunit ribosomal protein S1|nr:30S ribosomal protein S1 [Bacteroidota bacterium]NLN99026.1 30S ribosomal protein S1 [Bacteroidales bacterium]